MGGNVRKEAQRYGRVALVAWLFWVVPAAQAGAQAQPAAPWPPTVVAQRVGPSVVGIVSLHRVTGMGMVPVASGSGVVLTRDGAIVTNYHVVQDADALRVSLWDGRVLAGRVVGVDPPTDLAVVRVPARDLPAARWGDSDQVVVGEMAIAIGNPMGPGFARTVTVGVVSGLRRSLGLGYAQRAYDLIQTDAAISPGNSGGALVDAQGRVIGVNSVKIAAPGVEGMGFALPSRMVLQVAHAILEHGRVIRPWLGLALLPRETALRLGLPAPPRGLRVERVYPGGPADQSGIQADDALVALDGEEVRTLGDVFRVLGRHRVGEVVRVDYLHRGQRRTARIVLGALPSGIGIPPEGPAPGT